MAGHRTDSKKGSIDNDFATNNTVTGKFSQIFFPEDCTLSELLDENGNDVTAYHLGASGTTGKANTSIARPDGGYFSSVTGSAGYANLQIA